MNKNFSKIIFDNGHGQDAVAKILDGGGITINMARHTSGTVPGKGYMIGKAGHERILENAAAWNPRVIMEAVRQFIIEHAAVLIDGLPLVYFGAWLDGKNIYLDLSMYVEEKETALHYGKINNQKAVYELETGKSIPVLDGVILYPVQ